MDSKQIWTTIGIAAVTAVVVWLALTLTIGEVLLAPANVTPIGVQSIINANECTRDGVCEMNDINCLSCEKPELIRFKVRYDSNTGQNVTNIERDANGIWEVVCEDKRQGDTCDIRVYSLSIHNVDYIPAVERSVKVSLDSGNGYLVAGSKRMNVIQTDYQNDTYDETTTYLGQDMELLIYPKP